MVCLFSHSASTSKGYIISQVSSYITMLHLRCVLTTAPHLSLHVRKSYVLCVQLEEVMEKETYKNAKLILERFDPEAKKKAVSSFFCLVHKILYRFYLLSLFLMFVVFVGCYVVGA